ncbi:fluoroquinolone transport system ATP-binding protein [Terribacillus aidingensis]|uniref:Fluoroquinolone transport system ATP-binding protein n=1 Tax=Terribacillus aidingensis TaxID=586416 RepID=A0A285N5Q7_9BACI|nr:ABC transporter ATP-binding protein [Terribacillus aidingensis]SNZ03336.1 fluoroquinolone transport system ATP-binding protein [Terribacillus aidingensis]
MIIADKLTYRYPRAAADTLKGISFEVGDGEIFGFLGPSGAGKSTTLKILIGVAKNYAGSVRLFGNEMKTEDKSFYERIGVAFEQPNFYSKFTAEENLRFFSSLYSASAPDPTPLLEELGLEAHRSKRVSEFSKGMKMRLNFCRALLHDPDILFLDEPTSGLDPTNAKTVRDIILREKSKGKTIVINTHNMQLAEAICDRVAFVVDGTIPVIDSPYRLNLQHGKKIVNITYRTDNGIEDTDFPLTDLHSNAAFQRLLETKSIETIHTQEASLEDIFTKVTGRRLV